jgi:hypothetical protein
MAKAANSVEALGEAEPSRAAVREQKTGAVGELEVSSRCGIRAVGSYRQAGEDQADWLDGLKHEADGGVGEDLALFGRLMAKGEVARDHL